MRGRAWRNAFAIGLALSCAAAAAAEDAKPHEKMLAFLPATPGARACYARSYDAKHLAEHPRQRVTALTFLLRVVGYDESGDHWVLDPAGKYERVDYQFALSATRRGEKALTTSGYCPDDPNALCIRECDGGGVTLETIAGSQALTIRLNDGGVRMGACDEGKQIWLRPGADDKSFRVEKVAVEQCAALEKSEFGK